MRCFCIIRYTDSLPAWRTGTRPERSAGCNEKSPSVACGSTYFRVRPASPFPLCVSLSLLHPLCSSSPSGLNLRVSETGRAVPKARVPLLHLSVRLPSFIRTLSLSVSFFISRFPLSPVAFVPPHGPRGFLFSRLFREFRVRAECPARTVADPATGSATDCFSAARNRRSACESRR